MMTVSPVKNAAQAASYYGETDDYYREDGLAPTEWAGSLADENGLFGEVGKAEFQALLQGKIGDKQIQNAKKTADGQERTGHRPGYDLTFSADKTLSLVGLLADDKRAIECHRVAVKVALGEMEKHTATRVRQAGVVGHKTTGNFAAALFHHETNRAQEAQIHTHCIVFNVTRDGDRIRAIESKPFFDLQKYGSAIYQAELASQLKRMGYDIERVTNRDKGFDSCAIRGVSEHLKALHSSRRAEILETLQANGLDAKASGAQRQAATLKTRNKKDNVDHGELRERWRHEAGAELDTLVKVREQAEAKRTDQIDTYAFSKAALQSVDQAERIVSENACRFSETELMERACREAIATGADVASVKAAIEQRLENGRLQARQVEDKRHNQVNGYTTESGIKTERAILAIEREGRGIQPALMEVKQAKKTVERASNGSEFAFNAGQKMAAERILTSENRVVGLQGRAGSAKTTTVIKTVADTAREQGYNVVALAPTASAARALKEGAGLDQADTLASFSNKQKPLKEGERHLVILDETSLASAKDLRDALRQVENANARVLLVGDTRQIGSVGAGRIFAQLQENGMQTAVLDTVVRQRTDEARAVVTAMYDSDYSKAVDQMQARGDVQELAAEIDKKDSRATVETKKDAARSHRYDVVAKAFLSRDPEQQKETIVVDPTRAGRAAINDRIQAGLREKGVIEQETHMQVLREKIQVTAAEKRSVHTYQPGDEVMFSRDRKREGIQGGQAYQVVGRDADAGTVTLRDEAGGQIAWNPGKTSDRVVELLERNEVNLSVGDRLQVCANDRADELVNGAQGRVTAIEGHIITLALDDGREIQRDLHQAKESQLRLGYCVTAHAAQGHTANHVIAHLQSDRFVDQKIALVAMTRAKDYQQLVTDDAGALKAKLRVSHGEKSQSLLNKGERHMDMGFGPIDQRQKIDETKKLQEQELEKKRSSERKSLDAKDVERKAHLKKEEERRLQGRAYEQRRGVESQQPKPVQQQASETSLSRTNQEIEKGLKEQKGPVTAQQAQLNTQMRAFANTLDRAAAGDPAARREVYAQLGARVHQESKRQAQPQQQPVKSQAQPAQKPTQSARRAEAQRLMNPIFKLAGQPSPQRQAQQEKSKRQAQPQQQPVFQASKPKPPPAPERTQERSRDLSR